MPAVFPFACDAHMHVYDARFAHQGAVDLVPPDATVADYQQVQDRMGTSRTVVVTPRIYLTDNRITLDAIERLGKERTRGVAVLRPEVSDAELQRLHEGGVRGIRFTLYTAERAATSFDMVETLSGRVHELGWHVQLHWTADQIVEHEPMLRRLPSRLVFDHLARLPLSRGESHPAFHIVRSLIDQGRTWVKLSGAYLDSQTGRDNAYADTDAVARAWVRAAPQRLVWGSDWPHITERPNPPPTEMMAAVLRRWVGDEAVLQGILVDNPAELYDFGRPEQVSIR